VAQLDHQFKAAETSGAIDRLDLKSQVAPTQLALF